jgi:hypothetical protein
MTDTKKPRVTTHNLLLDEIHAAYEEGLIPESEKTRARNILMTEMNRSPMNRTDLWRLREELRASTGIYMKLGFKTETTSDVFKAIPSHLYAHQAKDLKQTSMIAFTKDEVSGEKDIQMISRIGKFLRKYIPTLSEQQINDAANEYTQIREEEADEKNTGLFFLTDPVEIVDAYRNCATSSCMSYHANKWSLRLHNDQHADLDEAVIKGLGEVADEKGLVHPAALYAFMPDVAVAVYKVRAKVVSRVIVNTKTKKWIKVYGNKHILTLLEELHYHKGEIYPTKLPIVKVTSPNFACSTIMAPYLDGSTTNIIPKAQIYRNKAYADVSEDKGQSLRAYSSAALPFDDKLICHACEVLSGSTGQMISLRESAEDAFSTKIRYCVPCGSKKRLERLDKVRFGIMRKHEDFYIVEGTEEDFIEFKGKCPIHIDSIHSLRSHIDRDYPNLTALCQAENEEVLQRQHLDYITTHIYKDSWQFLSKDSVTGIDQFTQKMSEVILPTGEIGRTLEPLLRIIESDLPKPGVLARSLYANGSYDKYLAENNCKDLTLLSGNAIRRARRGYPRGLFTYTPTSNCVEAITDELNNRELMPRSSCVFALLTGKWYAVLGTAGTFSSSCLTPRAMTAALATHGKGIMHANKLVNNHYPTFLRKACSYTYTRVDDYEERRAQQLNCLVLNQSGWMRWHEEIHASELLNDNLGELIDPSVLITIPPVSQNHMHFMSGTDT